MLYTNPTEFLKSLAPSIFASSRLLTSTSVVLTKVHCQRQKMPRCQRKRNPRAPQRHQQSRVGKVWKMIWMTHLQTLSPSRQRSNADLEQFMELFCNIPAQQSTTTSQRGRRVDTTMTFIVMLPLFNAL